MKLPKLTPSQWRSLATGTLAIAITINQAWLQLSGTPGLHIPPLVTALMQGVGILVAMGSRSLNKKDSGTGTGVVGEQTSPPADLPAEPAPSAGLMPSLIDALAPVGQLLLTAFAADLVAKQHTQLAVDATVQLDQTALLAAHAKIDAEKAVNTPVAQSPPVAAETPTVPLLAPFTGISGPGVLISQPIGGTP